MKILYPILLFLASFNIFSQGDTIIHIHKFPNGKTSTLTVLKNNHDGYAAAYNFVGKEIYRSYIRRYGGHASVSFQHHQNGMIKEAYYSSHPDGGIQWYRSWTYFDENGNKTGERSDNWDDRVTVLPTHIYRDTATKPKIKEQKPIVEPVKITPPNPNLPHEPILNPQQQKQEVVMCATIHENKTLFINHSKRRILLNINHAGKDTMIVLKARKMFVGPTYISAQISSPLNHNVRYNFSCTSKNCIVDSSTESIKQGDSGTLHRVQFYTRKKN